MFNLVVVDRATAGEALGANALAVAARVRATAMEANFMVVTCISDFGSRMIIFYESVVCLLLLAKASRRDSFASR